VFQQDVDIDATASSTWYPNGSGGYYGFTPIGNSSTHFPGVYNGQGHTITGIYISEPGSSYKGLFGYTSAATIERLGVLDVNISAGGDLGALIGHAYNSSIAECYSTGTIGGSYSVHGGLIGAMDNGTVRDSYSRASVSGTTLIGEFIGSAVGTAEISSCCSSGPVSGSSTGGFLGYEQSSTVSQCFWDTQTSGQANSDGGTGKTTAAMTNYATFTAAGWDFVSETANGNNNYWDADQLGTVNDGYPVLSYQEGADQSLPVRTASWRGSSKDGMVFLNWTTASETENLGFKIQRRYEGGFHHDRLI